MARYVIRNDGIEIRGLFRTRFFPWRDIAGFWLKEGDPFKGLTTLGTVVGLAPSSDEGWVTVRGGDQYRLSGVTTDEQIAELNRVLELGRSGRAVIEPRVTE